MIKKILKNSLKLGLLSLVLLLFSCEKDLYDKGIQNGNRKMSLTSVPVHKLMQIPKFNTAYSKAKRAKPDPKLSGVKRTALEEMYNFTLDTVVLAKVLEMSGKISYTMLIKNEVTDPLTFKNLVIQIDEANNMYAEIIKYNLSKAIEPSDDNSFKMDVLNKEYTVLIDEITADVNKIKCVNILMCDNDGHGGTGIPHAAGSGCQSQSHLYYELSCADDGGGGGGYYGGSNSDNGNNTSNNGGGGTAPTTIITSPVNVVIDPDLTIDPCTSLKKLKDDVSVTTAISNVMTAAVNYNGEQGALFTNTAGTYGATALQPSTNTTSYSFTIGIPTGPTIYGAVHSHPTDANEPAAPMFSYSDLQKLLLLYRETNPVNHPDVVFMLTLADGTIYALKIDNFTSFSAFVNGFGIDDIFVNSAINEKKRLEAKNILFDKKCIGNTTSESAYYEEKYLEGFLNQIKNHGITIYKAVGTPMAFNQQMLPTNPNQPILQVPCP